MSTDEPCVVCGATDHERSTFAFGLTVTACPHVSATQAIVYHAGAFRDAVSGVPLTMPAPDKPIACTSCPACNSPDTIDYWSIKTARRSLDITPMLKQYYPNARKCVDCEHVWW